MFMNNVYEQNLLLLTTAFPCSQHISVLSCVSQATDGDQHPLLDRAAPERPPAVARQGAHTNGFPQHPLL